MAKIGSLLEIQKNISEINFLPSELMMIVRSNSVLHYLRCMESCQDTHQRNQQKVGLCTMEKYCPNQYVRFFECKSKNNKNECFNEQVEIEKCMKIPINQMLSVFHKAKSY